MDKKAALLELTGALPDESSGEKYTMPANIAKIIAEANAEANSTTKTFSKLETKPEIKLETKPKTKSKLADFFHALADILD